MNELDDFLCERQCDEAYPWGDIAPFDWPEEYENDSFWFWIDECDLGMGIEN